MRESGKFKKGKKILRKRTCINVYSYLERRAFVK